MQEKNKNGLKALCLAENDFDGAHADEFPLVIRELLTIETDIFYDNLVLEEAFPRDLDDVNASRDELATRLDDYFLGFFRRELYHNRSHIVHERLITNEDDVVFLVIVAMELVHASTP